ncbi:hypothetical protein PIB30_072633 [Stylosanthes scabra]|uniref:Uncharacterized protein n=1 Tax=Stylosanthes scabra TaxID=79078 RepID=A0ABU6SPP3_9FABA|nr:hypothetical protein [Stylosanthes scabra]
MSTNTEDGPSKQPRLERTVRTSTREVLARLNTGVQQLIPISTYRRRRRPEPPRRSQVGSARHRTQPVPNPVTLIPEGFATIFRPTAEMAMNLADCKTAAYIFGHFNRIGEILFRNGAFTMPRGVFYSISPGEQLHPNVVRTLCFLAADAASKREPVRAWFLPCSFATHVWAGASPSEMDVAYAHPYMPATKTLRHVFIPVAEPDGAYYLVLIDLKDRVVYSLDVCRSAETVAQREALIDKLVIFPYYG